MPGTKILFVSQTISPYLSAGELSDLGKALPQALHGKGFDVRTFMPKFGAINERRNQLHEVIRLSGLNIEINNNDHPLILKVASMQPVRIQVYFIDNDDYFLKADDDVDFYGSNRADNDERAVYFARGTTETVKKLSWEPDIIQCSGWITALNPVYMRKKTVDEGLWPDAKVIYCIEPTHPEMADVDPKLLNQMAEDGIPREFLDKFAAQNLNVNTLHKMAIDCASGVAFLTDTPDDELLEYVKSKDIPYMLKEEAMKGPEAFKDFYKKVLNDK